jgi:hypothetical protein
MKSSEGDEEFIDISGDMYVVGYFVFSHLISKYDQFDQDPLWFNNDNIIHNQDLVRRSKTRTPVSYN